MDTLTSDLQSWPPPPPPPDPLLPPSPDQPSFHDSVCHYIDDILMHDENLEDQKCMIQQCILYHAAATKDPPDFLLAGLPPLPPLPRGSPPAHQPFLSFPPEDHAPFFRASQDWSTPEEQATALPIDVFSAFLEPDSSARSTHLYENDPFPQSHENSQWMDDLFKLIDDQEPSIQDVASTTEHACDLPEPEVLSSSSGRGSSSDRSSESSSGSMQYPVRTAPSNTRGIQKDRAGDTLNGVGEASEHGSEVESSNSEIWNSFCASQRGLHRREVAASRQQYSSASSSNDRSESVTYISKHRSKRTAMAVSGAREMPRTMQDSLLAEESEISYVMNKNLNAEIFAQPLLHGLDSIKKNLKDVKPAPSPPSSNGKNTRRLATTADLNSLLLSCAQAVGVGNVRRAYEILKEIRQDATPYGNDLQRLAHYFAEGLVARLNGTGGHLYTAFRTNAPSAAKMLMAHHHFVETCPFIKTSYYLSGSAIIKVAKQASRLHIVDYGISYGLQWPGLISALAEREGGPPHLRITGIDFPQPGKNPSGRLEMTGHYLAEYAKAYDVPFEYRPIATEWENVNATNLRLREDEVLVVNSMYRVRHLFDETVHQSNPREAVLKNIFGMKPKIFVQGIYNGSHNSPFFMSRFKDALTLFASSFDMLETIMSSDSQERMMIEKEILGRDILNVVACEGSERVERPETYKQWQNRMQKVGFVQIPLEKKMLSDITAIMKHKFNKNFSLDQDKGWMLLGWKGKVFNCLSLWKPGHND